MRIVFFGTSPFAAAVLSYLIDHNFDIVAVVTRPDAAKGRNLQSSCPPVKNVALEKNPNLTIHQPIKASDPTFAEILKQYNADLFVVVAYGEILRQNILDIPRLGCINIHASLLPKYRGAAPIHRAIMSGEDRTGITIIAMTFQMDAGDILAMDEVSISKQDDFNDVEKKLQHLACMLVSKVIHDIDKGIVQRIPQDHSLATLAPKLTPEEEKIDWSKPAIEIHNRIRALSPKPGAWTFAHASGDLKRLKILKALVVEDIHGKAGEILALDPKKLIVGCGKGALSLLFVQLEGKKAMDIGSFLRGFSDLKKLNDFE